MLATVLSIGSMMPELMALMMPLTMVVPMPLNTPPTALAAPEMALPMSPGSFPNPDTMGS